MIFFYLFIFFAYVCKALSDKIQDNTGIFLNGGGGLSLKFGKTVTKGQKASSY